MITASKKVINAWAMYDWANSVYNLVITTTFFPIYFTAATKAAFGGNEVHIGGRTYINTALYDYSLAFAYLIIALSYPILTSIADVRGNKKSFMRFFCYLGSMGCCGLFFFTGANIVYGLVCFVLAAMGYVGSLVFYNAFLPEISAPEDRDKVSAKGFSYGYMGSVLLQLIGFGLVIFMKGNEGMASRITFLLVGIWWFGFAQITFAGLPNGKSSGQTSQDNIFVSGFNELKKVFSQVRKMPVLKRYLRGFFFYSVGVQTVMLAATIFGSKLLNLDDTKLILTVVIIQLVAIVGAEAMSRLSSVFGNIKVLIGVVLIWIGICIGAFNIATKAESFKHYFHQIESLNADKEIIKQKENNLAILITIDDKISEIKRIVEPLQAPVESGFYMLAVAVGLVMGGIQSLSRSTYAKLMPDTKDTASFFSYYDVTEKIAIVIGMFSFGYIEEITGSMKNSVLFLIVFFAIGVYWLFSALIKQKKLEKSNSYEAISG